MFLTNPGEEMNYRAVGNRCAVNLDFLKLPVTNEVALTMLKYNGFKCLDVDVVLLACQRLGHSQYRRSARPSEAPNIVDCSSLMKWLYGERGIWLPRRTIQQRELGEKVELSDIIAGDLVFVSSHINYYFEDPADGVGHVGIVTRGKTIIHAANSLVGVVEEDMDTFFEKRKFRGARRYISKGAEVLTLETPQEREVETADDLRWIILQSLPR